MAPKYVDVDVDDYVALFPPDVAEVLTELRRRVHVVAPDVVESISYDMVTFARDGVRFVPVAGWKQHVSVYPAPETDAELARELTPYRDSRSTAEVPAQRGDPRRPGRARHRRAGRCPRAPGVAIPGRSMSYQRVTSSRRTPATDPPTARGQRSGILTERIHLGTTSRSSYRESWEVGSRP